MMKCKLVANSTMTKMSINSTMANALPNSGTASSSIPAAAAAIRRAVPAGRSGGSGASPGARETASGRPSRPRGRSTSTTAMTRNISTTVISGKTRIPKALSSAISTAARNAPAMLPMPPTTTTTNASAMMLRSISRLTDSRGIWTAPPSPASAAPTKKTPENRRLWLLPSAPTISRSWVAARTSVPQRVRWNRSHMAPSTSGPSTISARSYWGRSSPKISTAPSSPGARGPSRSSGPQIMSVASCTTSTTPKVARSWNISGAL